MIPNSLLLLLFVVSILLFFWGIYRAIKTDDVRYALALLPFLLLITVAFLL